MPNTNARLSTNAKLSWTLRVSLTTALGTGLVLCQPHTPHAQQQQRFHEPDVKVTGIAASGGVVSISADGSLSRAQTWQDPEGFHVVLVNGQTELGGGAPRGVKVRRIGNSLELVVPVKAGANVTVHPRGSRLDLVVEDGGNQAAETLGTQSSAQQDAAAGQQQSARAERARQVETDGRTTLVPQRRRGQTENPPVMEMNQQGRRETFGQLNGAGIGGAQQGTQQVVAPPVAQVEPSPVSEDGAASNPSPSVSVEEVPPLAAQLEAEGEHASGSIIFSLANVLLLAGAGLLGGVLYVVRRRRDGEEEAETPEKEAKAARSSSESTTGDAPQFAQSKGDRRKQSVPVALDRRATGRGAEDEATRQQKSLGASSGNGNGASGERRTEPKPSLPTLVFGAYRIEQEVGRLVQGQPHSIEVLSSRAPDDRRSVEASLLKALRSAELHEDGRLRARMALEDYGFVARQSATLLLASDSYDRVSAARSLGEMNSPQALPFLTEALYDADAVVRTESVNSLGRLGLPSAIGALLDTARRHPEIPASVLGPALTACSVESVALTWNSPTESRTFSEYSESGDFTGEICGLEPVGTVEQLPEWLEDETLQEALERLESVDVEARIAAAQSLAQFQVRRAVDALAAMAVRDVESAVRAAAITSLGLIDHESVFAPVLMAMADESREVRAAAARALSRLSFERADAYVRVIETSDEQTLRGVARACVNAGLAAQAIDRLASEDRRQAYEAFSLLSLAVKAGETLPILEAVEKHRDINVRLAAIRLLGLMYQPELLEQLHHIAGHSTVPEKVRSAIHEAVSRADHAPQTVFEA